MRCDAVAPVAIEVEPDVGERNTGYRDDGVRRRRHIGGKDCVVQMVPGDQPRHVHIAIVHAPALRLPRNAGTQRVKPRPRGRGINARGNVLNPAAAIVEQRAAAVTEESELPYGYNPRSFVASATRLTATAYAPLRIE